MSLLAAVRKPVRYSKGHGSLPDIWQFCQPVNARSVSLSFIPRSLSLWYYSHSLNRSTASRYRCFRYLSSFCSPFTLVFLCFICYRKTRLWQNNRRLDVSLCASEAANSHCEWYVALIPLKRDVCQMEHQIITCSTANRTVLYFNSQYFCASADKAHPYLERTRFESWP